ncbi:Tyrosine-protein phosphatase Lar [Stylophora pistillata]|uniref:Tyrosine-protein phosphatase Lar n=1 Tax=Stylophora pistillata TaxID=50429 RepID=A0A2B4RDR8_STYPI|nr:Tyrosine-protein phosphatase Lar [Stylophora pistillata]
MSRSQVLGFWDDKVLIGNDDRSSIVKHVVYGLLTRYLRFLPQTHQAGVCMRTEVFGVKQKPICEEEAIGVAFGGKIPDDSFSASTYYSAAYIPSYGRLKGGKRGWGPKDKNKNGDYLQIDLQYEYIVCAVATQGARDTAEWTKSYKIQLSLTGTTFLSYKKDTNNKDFPGNTDRNSIIKNSLQDFSSAKYIRFQPVSYNAWKVLRVEVYGILLSKVPSKPPTALKLTAKSSASINASWQLPPVIARHGTIAGFRLFYSKKGSREQAVKNGTTLSMLVSGLDKFTEYEFQVLAYTPGGDGPKSSVKVERTMEDVPSRPPSNFTVIGTSSTSVTASWQLPPADSRNGIIKGFKLFYKRKELSGAGTLFQINKESTLSKNVTGLDKYTEYEFRVLTFTSVGDGVNSSVVVKRTKEDVPTQPPSGLTVTATTSTSITASWQLPPEDSRNGIIRGFKLFYKEKGSSGPQRMQRIDNEATRTKEVIGLEKFTEYEFQILAFTSVGDGSKSTAVFIKTKEAAPSRSPSQFTVTVESSTSISVSWKSPPEKYRHGIIRGYKLFYKKKDSGFATSFTIDNGKTSKIVTNLDEYTEYEFQVLAFTSAGDGLNSSVKVERTMEDAPSAPMSLSFVDVPPSNLQGPRMTLSWHKPAKPNGVVRSYTLFYSHSGGTPREISELHKGALNHTVDVLGGATYQFHLRAVTIKPGANATKTVTTKEYAPSVGPKLASPSQVNKTTFNISWEPLPRGKSYGNVIRYEVKAIFLKKGNLRKRSVIDSPSVNTSDTFVVLYDLELCSTYNASVRAYTGAGPGPYGVPLELETSRPEAPGEFRATAYGANQVSLAWKQYDEKEKIEYTVKYTGTKDYNKTFKAGEKSIERIETTTKTVTELIPGTTYVFKVHGSSSCGESIFKNISVTTHMKAPDAPFPHNVSDVEVSGTAVDIFLWPVEQKYGPISAYQVIVLKVADGVEELPDKYDSKLKAANDAKTEDVNFYIAAEIENIPLLDKPQKFTVGDGEITEEYVNKKLEKGENYIVYERALTKTETEELKGKASIVARISISSTTTEGGKKGKSSGSNAAVVAVPVVLLLLLIPAIVVAVFLYRRRRRSRSKSATERSVQLDDLKSGSQDLTSSPTSSTIADFWRMVWQENSSTIVMLTNLVELGKGKCDQYWPDDATKFGAITVTLHKTETFADYVIRSLIVTKDAEKRNVQQFHYVTWPDKGVPHHSTALLGFRQKIHARHLATGGPLLVHCSAGVGRTGTYIAIDAMLESAEKIKTVFIQNYVQVMRKSRPHMIQKDVS